MFISRDQLLLLTMYKFSPFLVFLLLFSCAQDCSKCENDLKELISSRPIRVDVPEPIKDDSAANEMLMSVQVTADDTYTVDGEEYTIDQITALIEHRMNSGTTSNRKIKLEGDKMAHYEPFFKLLAMVQIKGLEPVLAYVK